MKALPKLHKGVTSSHAFKRTCWFCILCILSKCEWMNLFSTCDIIIVKQVWKYIRKVQMFL